MLIRHDVYYRVITLAPERSPLTEARTQVRCARSSLSRQMRWKAYGSRPNEQ